MTRRWTPVFSLFALVILLQACSNGNTAKAPPTAPEPSERVAMLMGGWPHAKAITDTGKATAFRIMRDPDDDFKEKIISKGIALTAEQRAQLVALLADDASYGWDVAKGCEPMPGVLVTFEDGATYARARFCFSCQMVGFTPGNREDFDPINAKLVAWVKGVFPGDELIQKFGTEEQEHRL